jgi:hypothetical protein
MVVIGIPTDREPGSLGAERAVPEWLVVGGILQGVGSVENFGDLIIHKGGLLDHLLNYQTTRDCRYFLVYLIRPLCQGLT